MFRQQKIKIVITILICITAFIYVLPSIFGDNFFPKAIQKILPKEKIKLGLDLQGGMHVVLGVDLSKVKKEEQKVTVLQALEVIRNRVDQFGISEPSIQLEGKNKIIVQLPGLKDPGRALKLIGKTANLEFKLLQPEAKKKEIIAKIDEYFLIKQRKQNLFSSYLYPLTKWQEQLVIREKDIPFINKILEEIKEEKIVPEDSELLLGILEEEEIKIKGNIKQEKISKIYLVEKNAQITGADLATANWGRGSNPSDLKTYNNPIVELEFNRIGTKKFAFLTKENRGKCLSICLDNKIYSAPVIQEEIPHGKAQISGSFTEEEAFDLAIVLRAGALPAPIVFLQEDIIGPSLGQDSIKQGILAAIIGGCFVIVFMIFYYHLSGVISIFALILNIIIIISVLILLKGTLTLPGIAGITLTFGMAVDANVIIFERIKEEITKGKTSLNAITTGYNRAFLTIFDSNLTTLIAAIILFEFTTGPIRGFAVTLSIGIITSMFIALVVTRLILELIYSKKTTTKISI